MLPAASAGGRPIAPPQLEAARFDQQVPPRKRKQSFPPPRNATPAPRFGAGPEVQAPRPTVAVINVNAGNGRDGLAVGDRVRIIGTGLYAGEPAVIEKLTSGVIPSALVRTEAGRTRQVRTIDLEPIRGEA
jgi:hypothetical protein